MPMANETEVFSREYYNRWTDSYETCVRLKFWFWRLLRKTWGNILLEDRAAVYDFGCGTGNLLQHFHEQYPNAVLYGSDISEGMLEKARNKFSDIDDKSAEFKIADMNERFPWDDGMFDYVISTYCFHHTKDPVKTLKEVLRVLKPGGKFYLADLCYLPMINGLVNRIYPRVLSWDGHIEFLNRRKIHSTLNEAGFKNITQKRISLYAIFSSATKA